MIALIRVRLFKRQKRARPRLTGRTHLQGLHEYEVRSPRFITDTRVRALPPPRDATSREKGGDRQQKNKSRNKQPSPPSASPWGPPSTWHGFGCVSGMRDKTSDDRYGTCHISYATATVTCRRVCVCPISASRVEICLATKTACAVVRFERVQHSLSCLPRCTCAGTFCNPAIARIENYHRCGLSIIQKHLM